MKRRPACVVSADAYQRSPDVIVAMVTSQAGRRQAPGLGDVVVNDWRAAGVRAALTMPPLAQSDNGKSVCSILPR
jgi:mRNA-degrading endonuclease toxin of MazEF toxin-antitoxin module